MSFKQILVVDTTDVTEDLSKIVQGYGMEKNQMVAKMHLKPKPPSRLSSGDVFLVSVHFSK